MMQLPRFCSRVTLAPTDSAFRVGLCIAVLIGLASPLQAQPAAKAPAAATPATAPPVATVPAAKAPVTNAPPKKIPKPEEVTLETTDGAQISATYYAGTAGKETVPVILLHMSKGTRADFKSLPLELQAGMLLKDGSRGPGHAVIVPDLRGHGKSTRIMRDGKEIEIDQATMRKADFEAMITQDMEAIKRFLVARNNAGELNIRKLCVVGAELGSVVAINWAALDWSWPILPTVIQGQDVRALVLLTPSWSFKGMTIKPAMADTNVQSAISIMVVAGATDQVNLREAKRLHQGLEKFHREPPADQAKEKKDLFMVMPATSLQGTKMLGEKSLAIEQTIHQFIDARLVRKPQPWSERKSGS